MAWVATDLDQTLVNEDEEGNSVPVEGAVEAMNELANSGHRLTVWTSRFVPMPEDQKFKLKEEIEQELSSLGFPPMEVWTGTTKPLADVFIGDNLVNFDGDWGLALAQTETMLEERGLSPTIQESEIEGEDDLSA